MTNPAKNLCVVLSAVLLLSSGCAGRKQDGTVIKWAFWGAPESIHIYSRIIDSFEEKHPGIKVELMQIPSGTYHVKLHTMLAGKTAPDIFWLGDGSLPEYAQRGVLHELDSLVSRDAAKINIDDFYPQAVQACRYKGTLYGIPKGVCTVVMAYNKDMFDEAGLEYPREGWTWDDFLENAKKLTKDMNNDGKIDQFGFSGSNQGWEWIPWILQNGGDILNESRTECTLDSPEAIEAIQFYSDLSNRYHVAPLPGQRADLDYYAQFTNRRIAMTMGSRTMVLVFNRHRDLDWDIVPLPQRRYHVTNIATGGFVVSAGTKHLEEAWQFLLYVTGPAAAKHYFTELGEEMPPRRSLAHIQDDPSKPPEHHNVLFTEIKYARLWPVVPGWEEMWGVWTEELDLVFLGKKDVKDACSTIKVKVDKILETTQ